jgi:hypothetical protein
MSKTCSTHEGKTQGEKSLWVTSRRWIDDHRKTGYEDEWNWFKMGSSGELSQIL